MYILAEDRLKKLSDDLRETENKLLRATKDLKNIGDSAVQEKEDRKLQIRQKLARKMQTVSIVFILKGSIFLKNRHFLSKKGLINFYIVLIRS